MTRSIRPALLATAMIGLLSACASTADQGAAAKAWEEHDRARTIGCSYALSGVCIPRGGGQ